MGESIRRERLRQILLEESVTFPSVKTWKSSKDPRFAEKLRRLNELTNRPHNPPIVVSVDEMGPISLQPYGGHTWARSGHPDRVPATYQRLGGVRYLMGAYDSYPKRFRGISPRRRAERGTFDSSGGSEESTLRRADLSNPGQPLDGHPTSGRGRGSKARHYLRPDPHQCESPESD